MAGPYAGSPAQTHRVRARSNAKARRRKGAREPGSRSSRATLRPQRGRCDGNEVPRHCEPPAALGCRCDGNEAPLNFPSLRAPQGRSNPPRRTRVLRGGLRHGPSGPSRQWLRRVAPRSDGLVAGTPHQGGTAPNSLSFRGGRRPTRNPPQQPLASAVSGPSERLSEQCHASRTTPCRRAPARPCPRRLHLRERRDTCHPSGAAALLNVRCATQRPPAAAEVAEGRPGG